jgi:hypothetical protein
MKRFILFFLLFLSIGLSADSKKSTTINNLEVTVTGEYKIEVFKDSKHMFSFDCRHYLMCEIFASMTAKPNYKMMDGMIYESDDLKPLLIENIKEVVGYNTNFYDGNIRFFVTITTPSASTGSRTMYTINTETGGVQEYSEEWDWYRYGMTKPKTNKGCISIAYC